VAATRASADAAALRRRALGRVSRRAFAAAHADLVRLARRFARDPLIHLALAEATWGGGDAAAALAHFERALALAPGCPRTRLRYGLALTAAGRGVDGLAALEAALAALPDGPPAAQAAPLRTPLAFAPAGADAAFQLGQARLAAGDLARAAAALDLARALAPRHAAAALLRGAVHELAGERAAALALYRTAAGLDPDDPAPWSVLERALRRLGQLDEADGYALAATGLAHAMPDRELFVANALLAAGHAAAARARFERLMARAAWAKPTARRARPPRARRLRVGVIAAPGRANTPIDFILDRTRVTAETVLMLDGFRYPHRRIAAAYDVLFNIASDPDRDPGAVRLAREVADRTGLPVANPPGLILQTGRARIARRLAGIAGAVVPTTVRIATRALTSRVGLERVLAAVGLPLLARPVGSHGGTRLERIVERADLAAYVAWCEADALYLTRFHDFRSADGRYRKLRVIFVDGVPLPYHLAIGDDWLVHYFRTAMAADAALRAEEAGFLADPRAYLGATAAAALTEIGRRMALGFCGLDGALLPDGRLLVFECNAAMLVRHDDPLAVFDYKRAPAEAIRDAVTAMLMRRAGGR
jgi:tetratricopeptide (TPR) repeat protein